MLEIPTRALRSGSTEILRSGLVRLLVEGESKWSGDDRDLMVALAPFHDCARRLGLEPATFFEQVASSGPASLADLVRSFGTRTDVTPSVFKFSVRDTPQGPEYVWDDSAS